MELEGLEVQRAGTIGALEEQIQIREELAGSLPELETFESEALNRSKIAEEAGKELDRRAHELGERRTNIETQVAANEERKAISRNSLRGCK